MIKTKQRSIIAVCILFALNCGLTVYADVVWNEPHQITTGACATITRISDGRFVEMHNNQNEDTLWYSVGKYNKDRSRIDWGKRIKWEKGRNPVLASLKYNWIIECHETVPPDNVELTIGLVTSDGITWLETNNIYSGRRPEISVNNSNNIALIAITNIYNNGSNIYRAKINYPSPYDVVPLPLPTVNVIPGIEKLSNSVRTAVCWIGENKVIVDDTKSTGQFGNAEIYSEDGLVNRNSWEEYNHGKDFFIPSDCSDGKGGYYRTSVQWELNLYPTVSMDHVYPQWSNTHKVVENEETSPGRWDGHNHFIKECRIIRGGENSYVLIFVSKDNKIYYRIFADLHSCDGNISIEI